MSQIKTLKPMVWGCQNCFKKWEAEDIKDDEGIRVKPTKCPSCGVPDIWISSADALKHKNYNLSWYEVY